MTIIIQEGRFVDNSPVQIDAYQLFVAGKTYDDKIKALHVGSDANPTELLAAVDGIEVVRIDFPGSADGRGLSIARSLRQNGYQGHIRAHGHVLADQYPLALRCGFDDVEISDELGIRQPESQWLDAFDRVTENYQTRLMHPVQRPVKVA